MADSPTILKLSREIRDMVSRYQACLDEKLILSSQIYDNVIDFLYLQDCMAMLLVNRQVNTEVEDFIVRKHPFSVLDVRTHKQTVAKLRRAMPGVIVAEDSSGKSVRSWSQSKYCRMLVTMKTKRGRAKSLHRVLIIVPGCEMLYDFFVMLGTIPDSYWRDALSEPSQSIRSHCFKVVFFHLSTNKAVRQSTERRLLGAIDEYWWDFQDFSIASTLPQTVKINASVTATSRHPIEDVIASLDQNMKEALQESEDGDTMTAIRNWEHLQTLSDMLMLTRQWRNFQSLCDEYSRRAQDNNGVNPDEQQEVVSLGNTFAIHRTHTEIYLSSAYLNLASDVEEEACCLQWAYKAELHARKRLDKDQEDPNNLWRFAFRAGARQALGQYSNAEDDCLAALSINENVQQISELLDKVKQRRLEMEAADVEWSEQHPVPDIAEEHLEHWKYLERLWEVGDVSEGTNGSLVGRRDDSISTVVRRLCFLKETAGVIEDQAEEVMEKPSESSFEEHVEGAAEEPVEVAVGDGVTGGSCLMS